MFNNPFLDTIFIFMIINFIVYPKWLKTTLQVTTNINESIKCVFSTLQICIFERRRWTTMRRRWWWWWWWWVFALKHRLICELLNKRHGKAGVNAVKSFETAWRLQMIKFLLFSGGISLLLPLMWFQVIWKHDSCIQNKTTKLWNRFLKLSSWRWTGSTGVGLLLLLSLLMGQDEMMGK